MQIVFSKARRAQGYLLLIIFLTVTASPAFAQNGQDFLRGMLGIIGDEMQRHQQDRQSKDLYRRAIPIAERCEAGDVSACDLLLHLPLPPQVHTAAFDARLRAIEASEAHESEDHPAPAAISSDFDACLGGSDSACERALKKGDAIETMVINSWRRPNADAAPSANAAPSPAPRPAAQPAPKPVSTQRQALQTDAPFRKVNNNPFDPASGLRPALGGMTVLLGLVAAFLSIALIYFLRTRRPQASPFARVHDASQGAATARSDAAPEAARRHPAFAPQPAPPSAVKMKTANQALRLATAYLDDAAKSNLTSPDPVDALELRNFAAMAMRQLRIAAENDPTATITLTSPETGDAHVWTQSALRAKVLYAEAVSYFHDKPKRAIEILRTTTEADPTFTDHYHALGLLYGQDYRRADAVACFEKALQYDPDNIELLKALDQAQHMSAASGHLHHAAASVRFARAIVYPFYYVFVGLPLRFFWYMFRVNFPFR